MALQGSKSVARLAECDPKMQKVVLVVAGWYDLAVTCGHRGEEAQAQALRDGFSRLPYPESKHNSNPSTAVDLAPWPINWDNVTEWYYLAGLMEAAARGLDTPIVWGGRWKKLKDLPHFELAG